MKKSASALLISACISAYAQDWSAVQQKLASEYALTQPTAALDDIVTAGAVLVLKKGNVVMVPVTGTNLFQNTYKDGKLTQGKAYLVEQGRKLWSQMLVVGNGAPAGLPSRVFVAGEKLFVTRIDVKDDGVTFALFSDAYKDTSGNDVRYKADLKFQFPRGFTPTTEQAEKIVAEVFTSQPAEVPDATGQAQTFEASKPAPPAPATPESAPSPIPPPPPPPSDPQTISLGQTPAQVTAILGPAKSTAKHGAKQIYTYKNMTVTFVNGKVTDVQ
jgi:hypothetical protein